MSAVYVLTPGTPSRNNLLVISLPVQDHFADLAAVFACSIGFSNAVEIYQAQKLSLKPKIGGPMDE